MAQENMCHSRITSPNIAIEVTLKQRSSYSFAIVSVKWHVSRLLQS
jgi:hypothetical protein